MSRGAEIFATRWTPIVVRNLLRGCRTFGEIHAGVPGMSRTLLVQRLRMLEHHGIIDRRPAPSGRGFVYEPTEAGRALRPVCDALAAWGERWIEMAPEHFDAGTLLWGFCTGLPEEHMPDRRVVVRIALSGSRDRYWLLIDPPDAEVCATPPGFDEDLVVTTTPEWLARWHTGQVRLGQAMRDGRISVEGPRELTRWLAGVGGTGSVQGPLAGR
jgi:DNA-binding HxlR family transcriptional regulator